MILPARDTHWDPKTAHLYQQDVWDAAMPYVKNWRVAIDCGAHVGIFTRRMEQRFEEVYAFEPCADNFRCLAQNTTKARLFNCLLWSEANQFAMKLDDHPNTGAGEVDRSAIGDYPAIHLDTMYLRDVGLMKLDVQDAESEVLNGSCHTIQNWAPVLIVENTGRDILLIPTLQQLGYTRVEKIRRDEIWIRK